MKSTEKREWIPEMELQRTHQQKERKHIYTEDVKDK